MEISMILLGFPGGIWGLGGIGREICDLLYIFSYFFGFFNGKKLGICGN